MIRRMTMYDKWRCDNKINGSNKTNKFIVNTFIYFSMLLMIFVLMILFND